MVIWYIEHTDLPSLLKIPLKWQVVFLKDINPQGEQKDKDKRREIEGTRNFRFRNLKRRGMSTSLRKWILS